MNKDTWESLAEMGHSPKMIEAMLDEQEDHMKIYTVWVGGIEVTDYLVNYQQANEILKSYLDDGYTDIKIEKIEESKNEYIEL
mgnify:CR=1 FL=1|jgi:hypothetical protein